MSEEEKKVAKTTKKSTQTKSQANRTVKKVTRKKVTKTKKGEEVVQEVTIKDLDWFNTLIKSLALILAFALSIVLRNYRITEVGTSCIIIVLGFNFIAIIISSISYLFGLALSDEDMIENSLKLIEFFANSIICILLYLFCIHAKSLFIYLTIFTLMAITVLAKDRRVIYILYMVAILSTIVFSFIQ